MVDLDRWQVAKTSWGTWMAFTLSGHFHEFSCWREAFAYARHQAAMEVA